LLTIANLSAIDGPAEVGCWIRVQGEISAG
jgi:hypothetical protein